MFPWLPLQETGVYIPQQSRLGGGGPPPVAVNGSLGAHWKPGLPPQGQGASFGDFFGMGPTTMMGKHIKHFDLKIGFV